MPPLVGLLFAWTMVADSIVLITGIVPLVLVCALRARPGGLMGARAAAGLSGGTNSPWPAGGRGGRRGPPVRAAGRRPPWADTGNQRRRHPHGPARRLQHGPWVTLQAFLELFGANVFGPSSYGARPALEVVFAALHLAGAIAVAWALGVAVGRIFRFGELIVPCFAVAILLNLGTYLISAHAQDLLSAREIAEVLPLGAVLAGRVLGDRVLAWLRAARTWFAPALAVLAASCLAALGYGAAQPPVPPANEALATWLVAHRLGDGLAGYWQANSTTVDSGGRVLVSAVTQGADGKLVPYHWETDDANYDPARHFANIRRGGRSLRASRHVARRAHLRPPGAGLSR